MQPSKTPWSLWRWYVKLNKIEKLKCQEHPCSFYKKLNSLQAENITEADRFYLKNFGIYNMKLRPEKFMLRLRFLGGRVGFEALQAIWQEIAHKEIELLVTARAQLEIHNLSLQEAIAMHKNLEKKGVTSFQTLTDNLRNIVTDPLDGVGEGALIEVYPLMQKMEALFLKKEEFIGMLPRKCNTAISGMKYNISSFFGNDIYFALAKRGSEFGFRLFLGGRHSDLAKDTKLFVPRDEVVPIFYAVIAAYKKHGLRASRTKARLFHLLEEIGIDGFLQKMREFYHKEYIFGGKVLIEKKIFEDEIALPNGSIAHRYRTNFGKISKEIFYHILQLSKSCEVRFGVDQNIYIFSTKSLDLPKPMEYRDVLVCAGERYCAFSLTDTKEHAKALPLSLLKRHNIRLHYSGCLKGCGRHILADIGLVGIRTNLFGKVERGVRVYIGGEYTYGKATARLIFWAVPLRKLNELLCLIVEDFVQSGFGDFEEYGSYLRSFTPEEVAYYYLKRLAKEEARPGQKPTHQELKSLEQRLFS